MKKLLGIIILFFTLAFSLLLESNANQAPIIQTSGSIQTIQKESFDFIANNILDRKTSTYEEKNTKEISTSTPLALSANQTNCLLGSDRANYIGCFIQNLSTEKQKIHQIRAP